MRQRLRQLDRGFSSTVVPLLRCVITVLQFLGDVLIILFSALPLLLVVGIYLLLDYLGGISLLPKAVLVVCLVGLPCSLLIVGGRSRRTRYAVSGVVLVLLLAVSPVDWHSRKPIFRAFYAIEPGMTIDEVDRLMAPALGSATAVMGPVRRWRYQNPDLAPFGDHPWDRADTRLSYRPWDQADVSYVHFANGRVKERYFDRPWDGADMLSYRPWDCADIFFVHFVDGRVTERHFEPD